MTAPLLALLLLLAAALPAPAQTPELRFPVACAVGRSCFVQNYVDHDASAGARDHRCGSLTYDGHNGTDIRVPSLAAQRAGVDVLAAGGGRVLRVRDGVRDASVRSTGREAVEGRECGNGLVIDHGDGWETQYCHLAAGSLRARPGEAVAAGQAVGRIGLSGLTEYPHLHFTVRHRGAVVDPFAFGAAPGACRGGTSLWEASLQPLLAYRPSAVLNAGFAPGPVTMQAIESGDLEANRVGADAPALVAYVRAIGLKAGDVQRLTLRNPAGAVIAENAAEPLARNQAQTMLFAGGRRPPDGWPGGTYQASYAVTRDGGVVLEREFRLDL